MVVQEMADLTGRGKKGLVNALRDPVGQLGSLQDIQETYRLSERQWMEQQQHHNTATTSTTRLAMHVQEAVDADPLCGPVSDRNKHFIGIEYEVVLEQMLQNMGECWPGYLV